MSLTPDCLARLKLKEPPFEALSDEAFLYSDPLLDSLVETAVRALAAPGAIVVLGGADGSGRTLQLQRLLGMLAEDFELVAFKGRANTPFEAVDVTIRSHLGGVVGETPKGGLADLLAANDRRGAALVLAIDDAHRLGMETIDRLLRLRAQVMDAGGRGLRLVLVGDQALSSGRLPLGDPADENQVVRLNLRPFNLEQAGAYLRHRLRVAGLDDPEAVLTLGDIASLQTASRGLPAQLNANANAWLARRCRGSDGARQAARGRNPPSRRPWAAAVPAAAEAAATPAAGAAGLEEDEDAVALSAAGLLELEAELQGAPAGDREMAQLLVREDQRTEGTDFEAVLRHVRRHQESQESLASGHAAAARLVGKSRAKPVAAWDRPWLLPAIIGVVLAAIGIPVAVNLLTVPSAPPMGETDSLLEDQASADEATPAPAGTTADPDTAPAAAGGGRASATPADQEGDGAAAESAPVVAQGAAADTEPGASSASAAADATDAATGTDAVPGTDEAVATTPESAVMAQHQAWLERQDPQRFTIQLVAARDLETARAFVEPHQLPGVHFIRTRSFYVALVGSFPERGEAKRLLPELPSAVRDNGPWIRTLGSVLESQR